MARLKTSFFFFSSQNVYDMKIIFSKKIQGHFPVIIDRSLLHLVSCSLFQCRYAMFDIFSLLVSILFLYSCFLYGCASISYHDRQFNMTPES